MQGKKARFCTGCCSWRLALLSCVLALHLMSTVHGNAVGTNATDPEGAANATSLLSEEEGRVKANEAVVAVTLVTSSAGPGTVDLVTPRAGRVPRSGEEEEQSSGMFGVFGETAAPPVEEAGVAAPPQLSDDSAETEHLLPSNPRIQEVMEGEEAEEEEVRPPHTDPPWINAKDTPVFDLDRLSTTTAPPPAAAHPDLLHPDLLHPDMLHPSHPDVPHSSHPNMPRPSHPDVLHPEVLHPSHPEVLHPLHPEVPRPSHPDMLHPSHPEVPHPFHPEVPHPSHPDVLHVDFFDPSSRGRGLDLAPPSPSSLAHELQGGDPTSWAMLDNYDYLTPFEDGVSPTADEYTYSTTTDTYESNEDLKLSPGSPARSRPRAPGSGVIPPGSGAALSPDAAPPPPASPVDGADGLGGCRVGYQMQNGSCRSPCDTLPSYCFNGGQCYLLEGMGVFCRCNVQDYIWHKGSRCESVVTEFQVMCLAVGASALVLLLLFMIVVCFAKKLHVLKTENNRLRKRSKYRPSSEQHNDNFSLSTIAEGSHPNDDPNSQNKLEDPVKAPPKEDETLNIHNSLTPKHENHKVLGEENSSEVNSLQNNMM